jgi:hypothetical protein
MFIAEPKIVARLYSGVLKRQTSFGNLQCYGSGTNHDRCNWLSGADDFSQREPHATIQRVLGSDTFVPLVPIDRLHDKSRNEEQFGWLEFDSSHFVQSGSKHTAGPVLELHPHQEQNPTLVYENEVPKRTKSC